MLKPKQIKIDLRKIDKNKVDILTKQFVDQMSTDANSEGSIEAESLCLLTYMDAFIASYLTAMGALPGTTNERIQNFRRMVGHIEAKIPEFEEWQNP